MTWSSTLEQLNVVKKHDDERIILLIKRYVDECLTKSWHSRMANYNLIGQALDRLQEQKKLYEPVAYHKLGAATNRLQKKELLLDEVELLQMEIFWEKAVNFREEAIDLSCEIQHYRYSSPDTAPDNFDEMWQRHQHCCSEASFYFKLFYSCSHPKKKITDKIKNIFWRNR